MDAVLQGLVTGDSLDACYRRRNVQYSYSRVVKENVQSYLDKGWEKTKGRSRTHVRVRKPKDAGTDFEDRMWCVFRRMGFEEMNAASSFVIPRYESALSKQVDVFAREGQVLCIVECKAAEQPHTKRQLDKDIDQLSGIRPDLVQSIIAHYRGQDNPDKFKFIWLLALDRIDISQADKERATKAGIRVIDEDAVRYYTELSKHFGNSAKYQFLADMLPGAEIPGLVDPVPALKGKMGHTVFYSFVIEPEKLLKIAYVAHRAKTTEESMMTYQRMVSKKRLTAIAKYIHDQEGLFPTNIVLNINTNNKPLRFDVASDMGGKNAVLGTLYIPNRYKTAWVIDGQHRLFAYAGLEEATSATLPVIAFEDLNPDVQAKLFTDINGEQVRVSRNLLTDLYADFQWNSPIATNRLMSLVSRVVRNLSVSSKSPLRGRIINIGGGRTDTRNITATAIATELRASRLVGFVRSPKAKEISPGPLSGEDLDSSLARATDVTNSLIIV